MESARGNKSQVFEPNLRKNLHLLKTVEVKSNLTSNQPAQQQMTKKIEEEQRKIQEEVAREAAERQKKLEEEQ